MSRPQAVVSFPRFETPAQGPAAVCVTGLPGAGTEMVAGLLEREGLWFGNPEMLTPTSAGNGLHARAVVDVNDHVTQLLAERRTSSGRDSTSWTDLPGLAFLKARARGALETISSSAGGRPWGWRHPHDFNTLPFWCELISPLKAVVCVRNQEALTPKSRGESVAVSKAKPIRTAYETILRTKLPPWQILVTHYESWFVAPERELERIAGFLGLARAETATFGDPWAPLRVPAEGEDNISKAVPVALPWGKRQAA